MATPQMQIQSFATSFLRHSPGSLRINTFNPDGTPLDVHTGYTLDAFKAQPSTDINPWGPSAADLKAQMTAAFDTTGVSLSWTGVQSNAILALLSTATQGAIVYLSNDAGTTNSVVAEGTILQDPLGGSALV